MVLKEYLKLQRKIKNVNLVIDIQGDQPLVDPKAIDETIKFHKKNKKFDIVLPSMPINKQIDDQSLVKTIFSNNGKIIYFSREKTPYNYYNKNLNIIKTYRLYHLNQKL